MTTFRQIFVPRDAGGAHALTDFKDALLSLAGGYTQGADCFGAWTGPNGEVIYDNVRPFFVACDADKWDRIVKRAFELWPNEQAIFHASIGRATIENRPDEPRGGYDQRYYSGTETAVAHSKLEPASHPDLVPATESAPAYDIGNARSYNPRGSSATLNARATRDHDGVPPNAPVSTILEAARTAKAAFPLPKPNPNWSDAEDLLESADIRLKLTGAILSRAGNALNELESAERDYRVQGHAHGRFAPDRDKQLRRIRDALDATTDLAAALYDFERVLKKGG